MLPSKQKINPETGQPALPPFFWPACVILLAIARYLLGGQPCLQLSIHQSIVDSILAGNDWGRQALVGNLDNPFLPTVSLLATNVICRVVGGDAGLLLCSLSQAIVMVFFLRITAIRRQWLPAVLLLLMPPLVPLIRNLFLLLDPNWSSAVPAAMAVYHLLRWQEQDNLGDLLLVAVCLGLFAFSGPGPVVIALCTVPLLAEQYRLKNGGLWDKHRGIRTIVWAPLLYCIAIWFLWNSLIFNDFLFGLRDVAHRMSVKILNPGMLFNCMIFLPLLAALVILTIKNSHALTAKCLIPACIVIPVAAFVSARFGIGPAGLGPLTVVTVFSVVTLGVISSTQSQTIRHVKYAATVCVIIAACIRGDVNTNYEISQTADAEQEITFKPGEVADAPKAQEIIDFIDRYWPDSRVILVGSRLPAVYPDPEARRFVSKLNFSEAEFLEQAGHEQLYLLIPPPDGRFYPIQNSVLSDIYKNGRDWLFLEKVFPNNWQLWRSTVPPKGESKLLREKTDN